MAIASINPATGEKLKGFTAFNDAEIERRNTHFSSTAANLFLNAHNCS